MSTHVGQIDLGALALRNLQGWRIALCDYHQDIVDAMPDEATSFLSRAYWRIYGMEDIEEMENVAFAFQTAEDGCTTVLNAPDEETRGRLDDVLLGVMSALEVLYDDRFEGNEVEA